MVRGYRRKRYYTTPQRILIHLSSEGDSEASRLRALTQEGIATSIRSGRSTTTKWLDRMVGQGLVTGQRAHVPGYRIRKTTYRLTSEGWAEAGRLRRKLESDIVELRAPDIGQVLSRMSDVPRLFPDRLELVAAVSLVNQGTLDVARIPERPRGAESSYVYGAIPQPPRRLIGRDEAFKTLSRWFGSRSRCMTVTGIAGIGKSALVASWIIADRPQAHVFWYELHEWTTPTSILSELASFLSRLGSRALSGYLGESGPIRHGVAMKILARELENRTVLLVLDNFERTPRDTVRFIADSLLGSESLSRIRPILVSRYVPAHLFRRRETLSRSTEFLRLGPLDLAGSVSLLRAGGVMSDGGSLEAIASVTRGHPLLLGLVAKQGGGRIGTLQQYVEDEILRTLPEKERDALEVASIFRTGATTFALEAMQGVSGSAVSNLQAKNLLEPSLTGELAVHDLVRAVVRKRLSAKRILRLHEWAATAFVGRDEPRHRLEGLYHLVQARQMSRVAQFLEVEGAIILDSVPVQDVESILRAIPLDSLPRPIAALFAEIHGDSLRISGNLTPALMAYRYAMKLNTPVRRPVRVARIFRKMADIERCRGNLSKALGHLDAAMKSLEDSPNLVERAEALRAQGLVKKVQGNLAGAAAHLNESIDLATEASDSASLARGFFSLGSIEAQRGHLDRSLGHKREGLRIAESSGNLTETARSLIGLGVAYVESKQLTTALEFYDRGITLARLVGNIRLVAYGTMNYAGALLDLRRFEEAGPPLAEAKALLEILEEEDTLALLAINEGQLEMGIGRWTRAKDLWEHALRNLRRTASLYDLARSLRDVGRFCLERGEREKGSRYLREARHAAEKLGHHVLQAEINAILPEPRPIQLGAGATQVPS